MMKTAEELVAAARQQCAVDDPSPEQLWSVLHRHILSPSMEFSLHQEVYDLVYPKSQMIRPMWIPPETTNGHTTNIGKACQQLSLTYHQFYKYSIVEKDRFWMDSSQKVNVTWSVPPVSDS